MTRNHNLMLLAITMVSCRGNLIELEERPDILLILVDDMGWSDIGC
jgi:hypothetical protein